MRLEIKIHRRLDQIGGCITEISSETSRVFIDMGQNLPGVGEPSTEEQDQKMVEELFKNNKKQYEAVIYTHAHEDHVGLFFHIPPTIPQYISEGGKEILIAKYDLIKKGHEFRNNVDNTKEIEGVECIKSEVNEDTRKIEILKSFKTWQRTKPRSSPNSFTIGDICITPFFNCHSIYDSYMFLIEYDGERIWHTGDYREHGYMGKALIPTIKRYATDIDVLITEGTMLDRDDECIHEREICKKMACVMKAFKYVVVLASSTNIERLASIKEASKKAHKPMYICSGFMNRTMSIFTRREAQLSKGLFEFHSCYIKNDNTTIETLRNKGFILITGLNKFEFVGKLCEEIDSSEILFIYSTWDGYYKDKEQVALNPLYKKFRDAFTNSVDIHTSGHADRKTIEKVIDIINPKKVIYIHKPAEAKILVI